MVLDDETETNEGPTFKLSIVFETDDVFEISDVSTTPLNVKVSEIFGGFL